MYFRQVLHEERACASYLVGCPTLGQCVVVDPQGEPTSYTDRVRENGMVVAGVIDTHIHADHVSAARELASVAGTPLYLGPGAAVSFDHVTLEDGSVLEVGNRRIRAIHTPGHTPEHLTFLVDDWFLLTGDTLFVGDVGRVDLALQEVSSAELAARARQLHGSLERLMELPEWIEVYPGHYAGSVCGRGMDGKTVSTLGREWRRNRTVRLAVDDFVAFQTRDLPPLPENFHAIKARNLSGG
ncbi:MAG: MBL fold metallo-hydrolase [Gemmatimonadetes bacterium]|nr:MBL fold metallo-hydrolase [Gemmatimonadota bacterium]